MSDVEGEADATRKLKCGKEWECESIRHCVYKDGVVEGEIKLFFFKKKKKTKFFFKKTNLQKKYDSVLH